MFINRLRGSKVAIRHWLEPAMSGLFLDGAAYPNLSGQTKVLAFPAT
jgi:hypothetical protein